MRGLLARWVEAEPDLELVGSLRTGREAIEQLERINPDVVVLDVEMPDIDGITALPLLLEKKRDLVVIMASTLTRRNAEISMQALSLGAPTTFRSRKPRAKSRLGRLPPRTDRQDQGARRRAAGAMRAHAPHRPRRSAPRAGAAAGREPDARPALDQPHQAAAVPADAARVSC